MLNLRIDEFPSNLQGPLCWDGGNVGDYIVQLDKAEVASINAAVQYFHASGETLECVSTKTFPLPIALTDRLRGISKEVHQGKGFAVLRGIDPQAYSNFDNALIFCGLASHVGSCRGSNRLGKALDHIRDAREDKIVLENKSTEVCLSAAKLPAEMKFHADGAYGDIIAMYVKNVGFSGGSQYLASFWQTFNVLKETSPETLQILAEDVCFPAESSPAYLLEEGHQPLMYCQDDKVICQLTWNPFKNSTTLTAAQREAMVKVNDVARQICVKLDHEPGDIQFVNNLALLHARDAYADSGSQKRHMMRLGLRDPELCWQTPKGYERLFEGQYWCPAEKQTLVVEDLKPWHWRYISQSPDHG